MAPKSDMRSALAGFWSLFSGAYLMFLTFANIPEKNVRFADTILGFILGTAITTVIQWYFGSAKHISEDERVDPNEPV